MKRLAFLAVVALALAGCEGQAEPEPTPVPDEPRMSAEQVNNIVFDWAQEGMRRPPCRGEDDVEYEGNGVWECRDGLISFDEQTGDVWINRR